MQQELDADEDEHDAESVLQIGEILRDGGEGEVECAQAEDGEDVRGKHDERILCHREHGRDGVNGEGDVAGLDDKECDEEGSGL